MGWVHIKTEHYHFPVYGHELDMRRPCREHGYLLYSVLPLYFGVDFHNNINDLTKIKFMSTLMGDVCCYRVEQHQAILPVHDKIHTMLCLSTAH